MARLNEPPVAPAAAASNSIATDAVTAPESVEALKRRFIRQNRELAKNNSSQSLRIRSLELEVSKLLSDNLDLREQVLNLQHELHDARRGATTDAVLRVKCDLRAKLAELSGLIDGLDDVQEQERMPSVEKSRVLSPSQRQYRDRQPLAELMQEAIMPTINEHKMYPRRTLDAEEIRAIRLSGNSASTGSPDLGPPPVAHFDTEAPIKFSSSQESEPAASPPAAEAMEDDFLPSINLETRRRKRDSSSRIEIRRHSILAQSPEKTESEAATTILRTGAKRKLADRDTEKPIKPPSKDDFTFSRKMSGQSDSEPEQQIKTEPAEEPPREVRIKSVVPEATKPARKVLGDKSTNMSPKKSTARTGKPLKDDLQKPVPRLPATKDRLPSRGRRVSSMSQPPAQEEMLPTHEIPAPEPILSQPETPAMHDIFSPATSQPSASANPAARDTPPPSDLSSISNTTEGGIRPSRRARSAVNYAEPSLNSKMRRPDKQMVDAISGIRDPRKVIVSNGKEKRTSEGGSTTLVSVKKEPVDEEWRATVAASPLKEKSTDEHPPATTTTADAPLAGLSNSAAALSSAMASSRKRREQEAMIKKEEMDLYDFKDTSSPASPEQAARKKTSTTTSRRHSSVPKETTAAAAPAPIVPPGRTDRVASRRRSMML